MSDKPARWTVDAPADQAAALLDHGLIAAVFYKPWHEQLARQVADLLNTPRMSPETQAIVDALDEYRKHRSEDGEGDYWEDVLEAVDDYLASPNPERDTDEPPRTDYLIGGTDR